MRIFYVNVLLLIGLGLSAQIPCTNGSASGYPCSNVELMSFVSKSNLNELGDINDVWGWTDSSTGKEYAIVGCSNSTKFLDVTDPTNPIYLGILEGETFPTTSPWRDIKVINNFAFIGSDDNPNHGVQVFDLDNLTNVNSTPVTFTANTTFANIGSGSSHNIVALEGSEHIVAVGTSGSDGCSGGLIFIDVSNPDNPIRTGCFSERYVHDAVCFTYRGPDTEHYGKDICLAFNGSNGGTNQVTIIDASNTYEPTKIGEIEYMPWRYTHQGWMTDDHKYILLNDELDELFDPDVTNTRTYVLDMSDLDNPTYVDYFEAQTTATDHNLYIKGQYAFQANYRAGFRMLDIRNTSTANFSEVAYFDVNPSSDQKGTVNAWSVYPYFESGNILVSDIQQGLFILKPTVPFFTIEASEPLQTVSAGQDLVFNIDLKSYAGYTNNVALSVDQNIPGASISFGSSSVSPNGSTTLTISNTDNLDGPYHLVIQGRGPGDDVVHDVAISFMVVPRLYVDESVASSGNGSRWNQAFKTLSEALAAVSVNGAEIWMASGTYRPTNSTDRTVSFDIPDNVTIFGGFSGSEVNVAERDISSNQTILSGNIGNVNTNSDNSYHVVTTSGSRAICTLDGLFIEDGNANGGGNTTGGGLLSANLKTELRNCVFSNNFASIGSAIHNNGAILILEDCEVIGLDAEMIYNTSSKLEVSGEVILKQN